MKKYSLIFVLTLAFSLSIQVSAYNIRNTADIQTFFNADGASAPEKLKDTIKALTFHTEKLQNELNNGALGLLVARVSNTPQSGTQTASSVTPLIGIDLYATGTPMTIERITLQFKVKSNGVDENPATLIKSFYISETKNYYNIPVNANSFTKDITTIPGQTLYTLQLTGIGALVPSGGNISKKITVYANMNSLSVDREISVSIAPNGIRAIDNKGISSFHQPEGTKTHIIKAVGNRRTTPPPVIPNQSTTTPKTSFFKDFFKNVQAQVIYMFDK